MAAPPSRIFLLSPARASGVRAGWLLRDQASFPLAVALRAGEATLGELFQFASGLYFRGKLTYATAFARPPPSVQGVWIITPGRGLLAPQTRFTRAELAALGEVPVDEGHAPFRAPLLRDAQALHHALPSSAEVVLLGSIASPKYLEPLREVFGARLRFPAAFVGRGDLSRGGLLLRHAQRGEELDYLPVEGAARTGARPPRLPRLRRTAS